MSVIPDVVIVGGGIVGLACAEALAVRGLRCRLVDRDDITAPGWRAASWASAGMIAPLAEAAAPDSATADDDRYSRICRLSRDRWTRWAPELEAATGISLDYDRSGAVIVADASDDPGRLHRFEAAARRAGEPAERLSPALARRLVPDAAPDLDFGLRLPGEHRVDNRRVCLALRRRLADLGVPILRGEVLSIASLGGGAGRCAAVRLADQRLEAARVLVTAGAWSGRISGLPTLPVTPVRGQMLRLTRVDWPFQGCVRGASYYAVRRGRTDLLIGATEERVGFDARVTADGRSRLTAWLRRTFPGLADRPVTETWAGLRPSTPDGRPILGQVDDGVWVAAGHHRNGILLAPWTATVMSAWLADGVAPEAQSLVALHRFAGTHAGERIETLPA